MKTVIAATADRGNIDTSAIWEAVTQPKVLSEDKIIDISIKSDCDKSDENFSRES